MSTIQGEDGQTVQLTSEQASKAAGDWVVKGTHVPEKARLLLENYARVPPEKVLSHVLELRDRAFKAWPYPCIGTLKFLDLLLATHPDYPEMVNRLKQGANFLDAGCCLGQDMRQLLADGAPSSAALYGLDIEPAFFDLGYELFQDRDRLQSTFLAADLLKPADEERAKLQGTMDVVSVQSVFHLFRIEQQKIVARAIMELCRPVAGTMVTGRQMGHPDAIPAYGVTREATNFLHNGETWSQFWKEVAAETDGHGRWTMKTWTEDIGEFARGQKWYFEGMNFLVWTARREA